MSELKACPFCGGKDLTVSSVDEESKSGFDSVECNDCLVEVFGEPEVWNTRAPQSEWVSVSGNDLPDLDVPVRVWDDDGYSLPCYKGRIARRVKTNDVGDWGWYALDMANAMLMNVTHFSQQTPPNGE